MYLHTIVWYSIIVAKIVKLYLVPNHSSVSPSRGGIPLSDRQNHDRLSLHRSFNTSFNWNLTSQHITSHWFLQSYSLLQKIYCSRFSNDSLHKNEQPPCVCKAIGALMNLRIRISFLKIHSEAVISSGHVTSPPYFLYVEIKEGLPVYRSVFTP